MLPYLLLSLELMAMRPIPTGTQLHVRLATTVGSYSSKIGTPVSAVLIAPVTWGAETVIPEGSVLSGSVKSVRRVGFGIVRETAALGLDFNQVTLPNGESFPIAVRVEEVENGREYVAQDGNIHGERTTSSLSYRISGYIRTALSFEIHAGLAFWAIKTLVVQVPEPELYYPVGVELTLSLTQPMVASSRGTGNGPRTLTDEERADLEPVVAGLPYRTFTPGTNRPSDLVNFVFIGTHEQIAAAFAAAGWTAAGPVSLRTKVKGLRAVAEGRAFDAAPMSSLLLNQTEADLTLQKGLNDFAKRHHIRVWKQPATWNGQEIWAAAATRDINFAYLRPGHTFTHKIQADVDLERDKIAHDLEFTSCVDVVDHWERPEVPHLTWNGTGDQMTTDADLAVIRFNDCTSPREVHELADTPSVRPHGNGFQRIVRRQILSAKSDLLRDNVYWRGYEGVRWMVTAVRQRKSDAPRQEPASLAFAPFSRERMGWLW